MQATPGDTIMERGSWHDELLILSKGVAKTATPGEDGRYGTYEVGSFWGEMQFLGLEKQRTISGTLNSFERTRDEIRTTPLTYSTWLDTYLLLFAITPPHRPSSLLLCWRLHIARLSTFAWMVFFLFR